MPEQPGPRVERSGGPAPPPPRTGALVRLPAPATPPEMAVASSMNVGLFVVALFIGGFAVWSILFPLSSGAVAPGVIGVSSERKTVDHLEGGIVGEIRVTDGDAVEAGQTLIVLDDTRPRATLNLLEAQLRSAEALNARLEAERDGFPAVRWPAGLLASAFTHPGANEVLATQERIFEARAASLATQVSIYDRRIEQLRERTGGLLDEAASLDRQVALLDEAVVEIERSVLIGLESKLQRLLEMQRFRERAAGERARARSEIARIEVAVTEEELRIAELRNRRLDEVTAELREVETELSDLREQVEAARDVVARTRIAAPVTGVVMGLRVFTPGGVVGPGEPLMDIVPAGDRLVIEARVQPNDIDSVVVGLPAQVRLPAFSQLGAPRLSGAVIRVSADRFADERMAWYEARIALDPDQPGLADLPLTPGMQADVLIVTGARTLVDYLLTPIVESLGRALSEE